MVAWVPPRHFNYISVRRELIFLEASLSANLGWTVFQPNGPDLWAAVAQSTLLYLLGLYNKGMLLGASPEQAFFVRCDATTMTQQQIDNGEFDIVIGVALVEPAEFVIIRIGGWSAAAN